MRMPDRLHTFALDAIAPRPWKNGGGATREILCLPPGVDLDHFLWRVSLAEIAADGPFSSFPGVDRIITLIDGAGVHLQGVGEAGDGVDHRLDTPLQPFAFAGEQPVHARLLDGPCHDLNIMARRGACRSHVDIVQGEAPVAPGEAGLVLACRGAWRMRASDGRVIDLPARSGAWWDRAALAPRSVEPTTDDPRAALLVARMERRP